MQSQATSSLLSQADAKGDWLSAHFFFKGNIYDKDCDRLILDVVDPIVRICRESAWVKRFFFIRYGENGPHVRLRLWGGQEVLERHVKPLILHQTGAASDVTGTSYKLNGEPLRVSWISYEPEVNRYGGPAGMALAEIFFQYSSEISLLLLKKIIAEERSSRFGKALLLMVILLYVFFEKRAKAATFAKDYGMNYLKAIIREEAHQSYWHEAFDAGYNKQVETLAAYVDAAWERLETADSLSDTLDQYKQRVDDIKRRFQSLLVDRLLMKDAILMEGWAQSVAVIIPSYIHMMNNRLGVMPHEESYLAHLITRVLDKSKSISSLSTAV
jgi:thiopeptide-type bacteriocin biosynthesis protein